MRCPLPQSFGKRESDKPGLIIALPASSIIFVLPLSVAPIGLLNPTLILRALLLTLQPWFLLLLLWWSRLSLLLYSRFLLPLLCWRRLFLLLYGRWLLFLLWWRWLFFQLRRL